MKVARFAEIRAVLEGEINMPWLATTPSRAFDLTRLRIT